MVAEVNDELADLAAEALRRSGLASGRGEAARNVALLDGLLISRLVAGDERPLAALRKEMARALSPP